MSSEDNGGWRFSIFGIFNSETVGIFSLIAIILLAAPILMLVVLLDRVCSFIVKHVLIFVLIIVALAAIVGLIAYKMSSAKHKIIGVAASVLNVVPGLLVMLFYSIPYVIEKPGIGSWFDFFATLIASAFAEIIIVFFALEKENGLKHLLLSAVGILIAAMLIHEQLSSPEVLNLYNLF